MQPVVYPVDEKTLESIWRSFMASGQVGWVEHACSGPGRSALLATLCHPPGPPGNTPAEQGRRARAEIDSQSPGQSDRRRQCLSWKTFTSSSKGQNCAILLADGSACVHTLIGDQSAMAILEETGLDRGTYWSEGQLGTNALSLALTEAMPSLVIGAEHFFSHNHHLASTAAPIHDIRGRITGIIAIVGPTKSGSSHALALVMAAARAISNQLHIEWYLAEANLHLTEVNTVLSAISEGVIAWGESGIIHHANAQLAEILNINPAAVVGRPLVRCPGVAGQPGQSHSG